MLYLIDSVYFCLLFFLFADIVINVESEQKGGMRSILLHLLEFFKAHPEYEVCTGLVEDYVFARAD